MQSIRKIQPGRIHYRGSQTMGAKADPVSQHRVATVALGNSRRTRRRADLRLCLRRTAIRPSSRSSNFFTNARRSSMRRTRSARLADAIARAATGTASSFSFSSRNHHVEVANTAELTPRIDQNTFRVSRTMVVREQRQQLSKATAGHAGVVNAVGSPVTDAR
jgi:hypothetical protein